MNSTIARANFVNYIRNNSKEEAQKYIDTINVGINVPYIWEDLDKVSGDKDYTPDHLYQSFKRLSVIVNSLGTLAFYEIKIALIKLEALYNKDTEMIGNWWEWKIGIPYEYGCIISLLSFYGEFDSFKDNYEKCIEKFVRPYVKHGDLTYANKASICRNLYIAGLCLDNNKYIDEAMSYSVSAFEKKSVSSIKLARTAQRLCIKNQKLPHPTWMFAGKEGIYDDGSFIQHTSMPYIGTYGIEIIQYAALLIQTTKRTSIKIPEAITNALPAWIKAYKLAIYNGEMSKVYMGRCIQDCNTIEAASRVEKYIKETGYELTDDEKFSVIQANADRAIHQSDNWRFYISMSSDRVARYEAFDRATGQQNLDGWYQGNGATYLYTKDNKGYYQDYFTKTKYPVFLAGTTVGSIHQDRVESVQPLFDYKKEDASIAVAGGVEIDDTHSVALMQQCDVSGLKCKKSWFMFDDKIICLGTDINFENTNDVITVLEHKQDGKVTKKGKMYIVDGTKYLSLNDKEIKTDREIIYLSTPYDYQYMIAPLSNKTYTDLRCDVQVIQNDKNIQAVSRGNYYGINFWKAGTFEVYGFSIKVNNPACIGLKTREDGAMELYVSDYTQKSNSITITLTGGYKFEETNKDTVKVNTSSLLGATKRYIIH